MRRRVAAGGDEGGADEQQRRLRLHVHRSPPTETVLVGYPAFVGRPRRVQLEQTSRGCASNYYDGPDDDAADHDDHHNTAGADDHHSSTFFLINDLRDRCGRAIYMALRMPARSCAAVDAAHELLGFRREVSHG